jgi:hypothetical protein
VLVDHPEIERASIYTAAAAGDVVTVGAILDRQPALLNAKGGPLHWEPLLYACYSRLEASDPAHSTLEVARLLLSRGADPNAGFLYEGRYAFTALTGAFGRGEDWPNQPPHPDCDALARLLLDAGADPNDGQTLYNQAHLLCGRLTDARPVSRAQRQKTRAHLPTRYAVAPCARSWQGP